MEHSCLLLITFSPVSDEGSFVKGVLAILNVAKFTGKFTSCVIISFVQIIVIVNDSLPSHNELSVQHENFALIHWKKISLSYPEPFFRLLSSNSFGSGFIYTLYGYYLYFVHFIWSQLFFSNLKQQAIFCVHCFKSIYLTSLYLILATVWNLFLYRNVIFKD